MTAGDPPAVLVVDDEPDLVDLYAAYLEDDYEVFTATNGEAALDVLDDRSVDVVLLDRRMPELRGDDVLDRIRARGLRCRVALVTALEPEFDILELGLDAYLAKPVSRDELRETVSALLARTEYDDCLQELFALLSKRAALEATKPRAELDASDEFADLQARIADLRASADRLVDGFDDADYLAAFRDAVSSAPPGVDESPPTDPEE
jgi:two-component system response regulator AdeR